MIKSEMLAVDSEILIDLDDTAGYAASFLEGVFGGLIREGVPIDDRLRFKSNDEHYLIDDIKGYITDAINKVAV